MPSYTLRALSNLDTNANIEYQEFVIRETAAVMYLGETKFIQGRGDSFCSHSLFSWL